MNYYTSDRKVGPPQIEYASLPETQQSAPLTPLPALQPGLFAKNVYWAFSVRSVRGARIQRFINLDRYR